MKKLAMIIAILLVTTGAVYASPGPHLRIQKPIDEPRHHIGFTGKVTDKADDYIIVQGPREEYDAMKFYTEGVIVASNETQGIADLDLINIGTTVTGYYPSDTIMLMMIPAPVKPDIIVINETDTKYMVGEFDNELLTLSNTFKLNISPQTPITDLTGTPSTDPYNKKLLVFYDITTKSIPPQAIPLKIIILDSKTTGQEEAEYLQSLGILKGTGKGLELDKPLTRVEGAVILKRLTDIRFTTYNHNEELTNCGTGIIDQIFIDPVFEIKPVDLIEPKITNNGTALLKPETKCNFKLRDQHKLTTQLWDDVPEWAIQDILELSNMGLTSFKQEFSHLFRW